MARDGTTPLSLSEAYHAAQTFLTHLDLPPTRVDEPVDGVIELEGDSYIARVKYENEEVGQGALIALIKVSEGQTKTLMLFSATGFSSSAHGLAETHAFALFNLDGEGGIIPATTSARAMMPLDPFVAPFADPTVVNFPVGTSENPFPITEETLRIEDHEWLDCPSCGTTHHPDANFCAGCGGAVVARGKSTAVATGKAAGDRALPTNPNGPDLPIAGPSAGTVALTCRNCGSHDIALAGT